MQFSASVQSAALPEHLSLVHPSEIREPRRLPRLLTLWGLLFIAYWLALCLLPAAANIGWARVLAGATLFASIGAACAYRLLLRPTAAALNARAASLAERLHVLDSTAIVAIANAKGQLIEVNDMFCSISGSSRAELIGKRYNIMNRAEHPPEFFAEIRRTLCSGQVWQGVSCNRRKDGSYYWLDSRIVPTFDRRGRITRCTAVCIDITARKLIEEQLLLAKDAAEAASRAKSDFLAAMSHEIRTPMNGIIGCTELLLESRLDTEQRELADTIRDSGRALQTLIDDVLDLAKIEAGRMHVECVPFDAQRVSAEVMNLLKPRALQKGLGLALEWSSETPTTAVGDAGRFRQVLLNLGANALKFTAAGHVTLQVSSVEGMLRFAVVDSGIGIAQQDLPRLFGKFVQADSSTTRQYGGTGLGLAISKQLVELMAGSIGVHSSLGHGSTFWFTLPRADSAVLARSVAAAVPTRALAAPCSQRLRVLLAEDNAVNSRIASALLCKLGCEVEVVANGVLACERAGAKRFDMIFMDCQMPEMDGFAATRLIRACEDGKRRTPIVALTANAMAHDKQLCLEAGMDDHLPKPFTRADLARTLERWCLQAPRTADARTLPIATQLAH